MTIIINSETLDDIINNDVLKILKRNQKVSGNFNYYFNPSIGINLYNAKVKFIDKKFIVFEFDKYAHSSLLKLLKYIDNTLQTETKNKFSELFDKTIYSLYNETEDNFMIRCYLPSNNSKYNIQTNFGYFNLPRIGCVYNDSRIEFRNIWKNGDKYGFNIELKSVSITD